MNDNAWLSRMNVRDLIILPFDMQFVKKKIQKAHGDVRAKRIA
jgi:hypothetical protein